MSAISSILSRAATTCAAAVLATGMATSAFAQKAKDTLRLAFTDPIGTILIYEDSKPEGGFMAAAVFDSLICFNVNSGKLEPLLATSWKWLDDKTLELKLRDDVKFHDGAPFTAEDVAYTLNWLIDPNSKLRFIENYVWMDRTEVVDKTTVRIYAKHTFAPALVRLATAAMPMLPKHIHGDPAKRAEFGIKTPVGTGPFKADYVDSNRGIGLTKNANYPQGSACKTPAGVGKVSILPIPDQQTQIAQFTVGNLDALRIHEKDQADMLGADPRVEVTGLQGLGFSFIAFDASGRSNTKPLLDIRVRQALMRSIDRELITKSVIAGSNAKVTDDLCFRNQIACDQTAKPISFDRNAAKALLTEAGYPDGFEVELLSTPSVYGLAEALAGELRKIGVRAKVDRATFAAYRDKQRLNKQQILVNEWSSGGLPDSYATSEYFFSPGPRDYWQDKELQELSKEGAATLDENKRRDIYKRIFNAAVERAYVLPISTKPAVFVHTKEVQFTPGAIGTYGAELYQIKWK
jgi:peptide/nickel transport system substrate-binding protein